MNGIVPQGYDCAPQPAAGDHFVPVLQIIHHLLPLLLPPLLRHDQKKVENSEDEDKRGKTQPAHPTAADLQCQQILSAHESSGVSVAVIAH